MRYYWVFAIAVLFWALLITDRNQFSPTPQSVPPHVRTAHRSTTNNNNIDSTYIIRFNQYQMAHVHHTSLKSALPGDNSWSWVDRNNPASRFPTDFALITSSTHSLKHLTSLLQDKLSPDLFKDIHQEKTLSMRDLLGKEHSPQFIPCDENDDSNPCIKKRSGRLSTRPTIGLDNIDDDDTKNYDDILHQQNNNTNSNSRQRSLLEIIKNLSPSSLPARLGADKVWDLGFSGQGIKMGVFDTGIKADHPHIRNITERTNWTHEPTLDDGLGHGSFVAGVIGSVEPTCPGLAPSVSLYTFRVFTNDQVSYTSWFLDAFNYAMATKVDIVNLSIGGPDYLDAPFVEKVLEVTSSGIVMVSAIGNDGPLYGTLNNPADQNDVIGVGGIDFNDNIAAFSSRGMSTWELPLGHGRSKPDVMAYGKEVSGSRITGGCRSLSGTSVASPVVAGAVCLLASVIPEEDRWRILNPAVMKQALVEGAQRLPGMNMYEQGQGKLNVVRSMEILSKYNKGRASIVPAALNLADCPYMWPYCRQPLYANAMPVVFNATVLNGMGLTGKFSKAPTFTATDTGGQLLDIQFEYSDMLWPWSGYLAMYIRVKPEGILFDGMASGVVKFEITSPPPARKPGHHAHHPIPPTMFTEEQTSTVELPITAAIIPTPPRERRILWDQLHSLRYPPAYIPRDNLGVRQDILDWHGDHPHTNYHDALNALLDAGYSVELLTSPATCFDGENYGTLLVVDPEDEWYAEEIVKLEADVREKGMGLVVFAEWYDEETLYKLKFYDDNTRSWWEAATGGANVPALNDLLKPYGAALAGGTYDGSSTIQMKTGTDGEQSELRVNIASGSSIAVWPAGGYVFRLNEGGGRSGRRLTNTSKTASRLVLQDDEDGSNGADGNTNTDNNTDEDTAQKEEGNTDNSELPHKDDPPPPPPPPPTPPPALPPAILGLLQHGAGRLVVFGDSNCIDSSHQHRGNCHDLLIHLVRYASGIKSSGLMSPQYLLTEPLGDRSVLENNESNDVNDDGDSAATKLPRRRPDMDLSDISFVLKHPLRCYPNAPAKYIGLWETPVDVSMTNTTRSISKEEERKKADIDRHRNGNIDEDELSEQGGTHDDEEDSILRMNHDGDMDENINNGGGVGQEKKHEIDINIPLNKNQKQNAFHDDDDDDDDGTNTASKTSSIQIARTSLGMMVVGAVLLGILALKGRRQLTGWKSSRLLSPLWRIMGRQSSGLPRGRDE